MTYRHLLPGLTLVGLMLTQVGCYRPAEPKVPDGKIVGKAGKGTYEAALIDPVAEKSEEERAAKEKAAKERAAKEKAAKETSPEKSAGTTAAKEDKPKEQFREPDVIFVPTPQEVVDRMLEEAGVTKNDVVYDLGCGDGRIVVTAAKKYGCKAIGFDIDPERIQESLENVKKNDVGHLVQIRQADIFTLDLTPASVVTLYLLPELNVKLIPQLDKLKPGTRIVSHDFDMKGVKPKKMLGVTPAGEHEHTIYLFTVPLEKEKK